MVRRRSSVLTLMPIGGDGTSRRRGAWVARIGSRNRRRGCTEPMRDSTSRSGRPLEHAIRPMLRHFCTVAGDPYDPEFSEHARFHYPGEGVGHPWS